MDGTTIPFSFISASSTGLIICIPASYSIRGAASFTRPRRIRKIAWISSMRMLPGEVHAACDGKALRGTEEHILEVFINDLRPVVWQAPVGERENELSALEKNVAGIFTKYRRSSS